MKYRKFSNINQDISAFGFGCMRFPMKDGAIDVQESVRMLMSAYEQGVNYYDTAYVYGDGASERTLAQGLKLMDRSKVFVADKLPLWTTTNSEAQMEERLDTTLQRLETDYVDFYLLHAMKAARFNDDRYHTSLNFLDKMVKKGKIRFPAFSFHDELPVFKEIIDSYDFKMCQIQLNIIDTEFQAGLEGMNYAAKKGIPVVVMEPMRGGLLATNIPQKIADTYKNSGIDQTPATFCFKWLINKPEIKCVLSGVSTWEQLQENIKIFSQNDVGCLIEKEQEIIATVQNLYKSFIKVGCSGCDYCCDCPQSIPISSIFDLYNATAKVTSPHDQRRQYNAMYVSRGQSAENCIECRACEAVCPQKIKIVDMLKQAHELLK